MLYVNIKSVEYFRKLVFLNKGLRKSIERRIIHLHKHKLFIDINNVIVKPSVM